MCQLYTDSSRFGTVFLKGAGCNSDKLSEPSDLMSGAQSVRFGFCHTSASDLYYTVNLLTFNDLQTNVRHNARGNSPQCRESAWFGVNQVNLS